MKVNIGQGSVEIVEGDITDQNVHAIINAANIHFWMGSGVAGAIKKKGGQEIETEAVEQGPVEVGGAVITTAGALPAQYVIHAASMGQDLRTSADIVRKTTRSSLDLAEGNRLESIAFPAIGTGVGGLPIQQCAQIMLDEVITFLSGSSSLKTALFVLFGKEHFRVFEDELRRKFTA